MIYAAIGVIAVKTKVLDQNGLDVLSRLILNITIPVMLFTNTANGIDRQEFISALPVLFMTALMYLLLFLLSFVLARCSRLSGNIRNVFRAGTMYGNVGFIGIPIVAALFPEKGMLYIALFTIVDQITLWTIGLNLTAPVESQQKLSVLGLLRKMVNPAIIAIVLAVALIFTGWKIPSILNTALVNTGSVTTALAMIYMGGLFCYTDIPMYFKKIEFYF